MFREYKPSRALRSKDSGQLVQSRVQTKHGEAALSCYAANKWNKLPVEIKLSPNGDIFKSRLKTSLFSCVYAWNLHDIFQLIQTVAYFYSFYIFFLLLFYVKHFELFWLWNEKQSKILLLFRKLWDVFKIKSASVILSESAATSRPTYQHASCCSSTFPTPDATTGRPEHLIYILCWKQPSCCRMLQFSPPLAWKHQNQQEVVGLSGPSGLQ